MRRIFSGTHALGRQVCGHQSPASCLILRIAAAVHLGFGDTVVSSVKVLLAFESCHEEVGARPLSSLYFEAFLEDSFSSIFCVSWPVPLQGSSLLASGTWWDPNHIV